MRAENPQKKAYTEYEFVLGKQTGNEKMKFVRGYDTREELEEAYKTLLLQSDEDSETCLPYKKIEGRLYVTLHDIVFEAEAELAKKTQGQGNQYVM